MRKNNVRAIKIVDKFFSVITNLNINKYDPFTFQLIKSNLLPKKLIKSNKELNDPLY